MSSRMSVGLPATDPPILDGLCADGPVPQWRDELMLSGQSAVAGITVQLNLRGGCLRRPAWRNRDCFRSASDPLTWTLDAMDPDESMPLRRSEGRMHPYISQAIAAQTRRSFSKAPRRTAIGLSRRPVLHGDGVHLGTSGS